MATGWSPDSQIDPQLTCSGSGTHGLGQSTSTDSGLFQSDINQDNDHSSRGLWAGLMDPNEFQASEDVFSAFNQFDFSNAESSRPLNVLYAVPEEETSPESGSNATAGATRENSTGVFDSSGATTGIVDTPMTEITELDGENLSNDAYAKIIHQCLKSTAPSYEMQLQKIYQWFKVNTHRGRTSTDEKAWQNSIRHNLSMNDGFQNCSRNKTQGGKKYMWSLTDKVIATGKIEPTTRFRKQDRKAGRRRAAAGSSAAKQRSGSKGGRATKQAARRNPPRATANRQATPQYASPTPPMAPASTQTAPSPFDTNMHIDGTPQGFGLAVGFPASNTSTPHTPYSHLNAAASAYSSPHLHRGLLMPGPTSTPVLGSTSTPAAFMTSQALEMYGTPIFAVPHTPFMSQSPAPSVYNFTPTITVTDAANAGTGTSTSTGTGKPNQLQFSAAADYFHLNDPSHFQLQSAYNAFTDTGYDVFVGAPNGTGAEWNNDFSSFL